MADDPVLAEFNWNKQYHVNGESFFYLTDFALTHDASDGSRTLTSLLLAHSGNRRQKYTLSGSLMNRQNLKSKLKHQAVVNAYYIDVGPIGSSDVEDQNRGFWMVGDDEDIRYKLVYPAAPQYAVYAARILDLALYSNLFHYYSHSHETLRCIRMTNFSLTERESGSKQTPILPKGTQKTFVLKGSISVNLERLSGSEITALIGITDKARCQLLQMQTYIKSTYVVDFGREVAAGANPILWMEDVHRTWIKLEAPCHRDYQADYNTAMDRTINNVDAYDWNADAGEIWRHVTNFRLTSESGALHHLEISDLSGVFILWGDLQPPPGSLCPPIPIKLYVKELSLDTGKVIDDPEKGLWLKDALGSQYKLVMPASPDYRDIAAPTFEKFYKYMPLIDALVFHDISVEYSDSNEAENEDEIRYIVRWPIKRIHRAVEPKFDLEWVMRNKDFVLRYLDNEVDFDESETFIKSIKALGRDMDVDAHPRSASQRAAERAERDLERRVAPAAAVAAPPPSQARDKPSTAKATASKPNSVADKDKVEKPRVEDRTVAKDKVPVKEKERAVTAPPAKAPATPLSTTSAEATTGNILTLLSFSGAIFSHVNTLCR